MSSAVTNLHSYGPTHRLQIQPKSKFCTCMCIREDALNTKSSLWRTQRNDTISSAVTNLHSYGPTHRLQIQPKSKFCTCMCIREDALNSKSSLWRTQRNDIITSAVRVLHSYGPKHWLQTHPKSEFQTCGEEERKPPHKVITLTHPAEWYYIFGRDNSKFLRTETQTSNTP
jgi:hypothetical protein